MADLMERAELMDRNDRKFVFHRTLLSEILRDCMSQYRVLEMQGKRYFDYETEYFDTPDQQFYLQHHRGKANRYKIRRRKYGSTGEEYIELKHKTHKGNTQKHRVLGNRLEQATELLQSHIDQTLIGQLIPTLLVHYQRITLLHIEKNEKVTLDFALEWSHPNSDYRDPGNVDHRSFSQIVIAEVKSTNLHFNTFQQIAKKHGIREGSMSKYCMGCMAVYPQIKHNRFKQTYKQILSIEHA